MSPILENGYTILSSDRKLGQAPKETRAMKLLSAIALVILFAFPVEAQENCAPGVVMIERLSKKFQEEIIWIGQVTNGNRVALFANNETKTWSIIIGFSDGSACLIGAGTGYNLTIGKGA